MNREHTLEKYCFALCSNQSCTKLYINHMVKVFFYTRNQHKSELRKGYIDKFLFIQNNKKTYIICVLMNVFDLSKIRAYRQACRVNIK